MSPSREKSKIKFVESLHTSARKMVNHSISMLLCKTLMTIMVVRLAILKKKVVVITCYSSSQSLGGECEENCEGSVIPVLPLAQQSRSARIVGTSFSRYRDCYLY